MFTDGEQLFGSKMLPKNMHLKYKSVKTVKGVEKDSESSVALEVEETIGACTPVTDSGSTSSKIYLDFNFRQTVITQVYYTVIEGVLKLIIIPPLAALLLFTILGMVNTVMFYTNLAKLIQRKYFHAIEWQSIQKNRRKFETIQKALDGIDQFKPILEEINKFLAIDFTDYTYEQVSETKNKMQVLDGMLPNLDELEVSTSHKNEHEKLKQTNLDKILEERARFSLTEIVALIKQRVSIYGVYNLHDEVALNNSQLQAQIDLSNTKLEFLYRLLDKKRKGKKAAAE